MDRILPSEGSDVSSILTGNTMKKQIPQSRKVRQFPSKKGDHKPVVLVGGCFDVLHVGHIVFLEKAKKLGDKLIILLESDENIRRKKGKKRPINSQKNRSLVLSKLKMVDEIIKLPYLKSDEEYFKIIEKIKPDFIAVSQGDKNLDQKIRQAKLVGSKVVKVTKLIPHQSSSRVIEIIHQDL
jgi:rfaE bifunctional protein nucleotidyltransferase chain/domain